MPSPYLHFINKITDFNISQNPSNFILPSFLFLVLVFIIKYYINLNTNYQYEYKQYYSKTTKRLKHKEIVILKSNSFFNKTIVFKAQIIPNIGIVISNENIKKQTIYYNYLKGINIIEYISNGVKINYKIVSIERNDNLPKDNRNILETAIIDNSKIKISLKIVKDIYNLLQES
ncbi:hypothetical protein HANVADRAFT_71312 [Hanseniaspora valbyensis NRRL Y-1626]|uniref:Uncharacterized protein n=1 Tax=Hanseniaspora valbyensis NRRL Y-1626 TaxID=766949 RepID=A0A1B7TDQ4_9ASCO|nr:hypothetical protein HANVADRAFT_71312 [Hanseniaspora valbyensis NRRL Y-1626]